MNFKKFWRKISLLGLREEQEFSHREIVLLNKLTFIATVVMLPLIPVEIVMNGWQLVPTECLLIGLSGTTLVFSYFGKHTIAKFYFFFTALVMIIGLGIAIGKGSGNHLALIPLLIFPAILFNKRSTIFALSVVVLLGYLFLLFGQDNIQPIIEIDMELKERFSAVFYIMAMFFVFFEVFHFKSVNEKFQLLVLKKNEEIAEKNKEIVDSINYAKRIQDAYLPPKEVLTHFFTDSLLLFEPKDIVSGDFYWFHYPRRHDSTEPDEVFIVAADCTGHGVPGAIMSIICCDALNDAVISKGERQTGAIFDHVRQHLVSILKEKNSSRKDGMDAALCRINRKTRQLQFTGANNPLWILRNDSDHIEVAKGDKQPVGYHDSSEPFKTQEIQLNEGDQIYFFSDGFQDQFGGEKGKKFKASNLQRLILDHRNLSMNEQHEKLKRAFFDWKGDLEQVDDVCLIGIRV